MSQPEPDRPDPKAERLDVAVAGRLARLRTMPVDVSSLRRAVDARLGVPARAPRAGAMRLRWLSPFRAAAASLVVVGLIVAAVIATSGGPVLASPDRLAQLHQDLVSGDRHDMRRVASIEEARAALAAERAGAPAVPGVGDDRAMACCVHTVGRKAMSCVSMTADGVAVSMAVAEAADVKTPAASETVTVDGTTYQVESSGGVNMVMTRRGGRWVCLMGKLPTQRLIELAKTLRF